ncbi:hypothetical protein BCR32DRAFT_325722 [Anaeromyces robustus]|uniref:PET hydrolase/cutinase-like domain-containing protein n=1 Tax=Anaeromyces robustus TaxID=1754192 RepID=A0A1Y1XHQ0_9FUNG|nr:hypothetical protein BCR32DRAFT_325722 [Anaeromyces robustus]|eukprot:ORX84904.1 hypothetical protein BCR32DRAFT_325722 [Anaeromyces robustus]
MAKNNYQNLEKNEEEERKKRREKCYELLELTCCLFIVLILVALGLFLYVIYYAQKVPTDYTEQINTGGDIESKYLAMGKYETNYYEEETSSTIAKKYLFYYPDEMEKYSIRKTYPVVIFANSANSNAGKIKSLLNHMASWGFIAIGNYDEEYSYTGESSNLILNHIMELNENDRSFFYHKVDLENIGITGHAPGGVGVFNAVTEGTNGKYYKCAVSISPTIKDFEMNVAAKFKPSSVKIPVMLLSETVDEVTTLDESLSYFLQIKTTRVFARKKNTNHNEILYNADGYVTSWFMHYLKQDEEAGLFIKGDNPELYNNTLYQDQQISIVNY